MGIKIPGVNDVLDFGSEVSQWPIDVGNFADEVGQWPGDVGNVFGGGGGGGGENFNLTGTTAPWAAQQPYLEQMFQQAWDLPELQAYGGPRVAGFDPAQSAAMSSSLAALQGGGTGLHAAQQQVTDTLSGKYLDPDTNPYLQQTFQRATEQYVNPVTTASVQAGRFGSGAQAAQTGEAFARTANEIYGQNYQQERGRQLQMMPMAQQYAFAPQAAQFNIGAAQQGMNQQMMNAAQQQFQEQQMAPWSTLSNRRNLTMGDFGSQTQQSGIIPTGDGGICFITTAICTMLGKGDNCYELNLLRKFRDGYIKKLPFGKSLIAEYYGKAPSMMAKINLRQDKDEILKYLYERFLRRSIIEIERKNSKNALSIYKEMFLSLSNLIGQEGGR